MYLENKLNSTFSLDDDPVEENNILPKVQKLINSGNGDPSRLQHIYDTLSNNKPPYHSDQVYLKSKYGKLGELIFHDVSDDGDGDKYYGG